MCTMKGGTGPGGKESRKRTWKEVHVQEVQELGDRYMYYLLRSLLNVHVCTCNGPDLQSAVREHLLRCHSRELRLGREGSGERVR